MTPPVDPTRTQTGGGSELGFGSTLVRRVHVAHGPGAGTVALLEAGRSILVGRTGHVDGPLALPDGEISKHHATLEWDAQARAFAIVDHGSRNGTFLDGRRCVRAPLRDGSVLRVGGSLLLVEEVEVPAHARLGAELPGLPGPSLGLQRVRGEISLVAAQDLPVLVLGASGVGKELVAAELHRQSGRSGPFVAVNCAAIAPELAESELFGHAAGAFTGAARRSEGLFLAAQHGTLFLDEVGELALELQAKLLRALAQGEIRPVGSTQTIATDVRIVAATHRDLAEAVDAGAFRGDLFARLAGWTLRVPPLQARRQDVLALAKLFLGRRGRFALTPDAAEALLLHPWRYNVRELQQVLAAASIRAAGAETIRREHLPAELTLRLADREFRGPPATPPPRLELIVPRDRPPTHDELCQVLARTNGNMAEVADYFGKDRKQVYRWAERLGVRPEEFRKTFEPGSAD